MTVSTGAPWEAFVKQAVQRGRCAAADAAVAAKGLRLVEAAAGLARGGP